MKSNTISKYVLKYICDFSSIFFLKQEKVIKMFARNEFYDGC